MGLRSWLDGKLTRPPEYDLSPRRIRRELARQQAAENDGAASAGEDLDPQHLGGSDEMTDLATADGGTRSVDEGPD